MFKSNLVLLRFGQSLYPPPQWKLGLLYVGIRFSRPCKVSNPPIISRCTVCFTWFFLSWKLIFLPMESCFPSHGKWFSFPCKVDLPPWIMFVQTEILTLNLTCSFCRMIYQKMISIYSNDFVCFRRPFWIVSFCNTMFQFNINPDHISDGKFWAFPVLSCLNL